MLLDQQKSRKTLLKSLSPADRIFSTLTKEFKQALLDNKAEDIKALLNQYDLFETTCPEFLKFYHSKLIKHMKITPKLIEPKSLPPPIPAAQPTYQIPNPKTVSMKLPRAEPTKWSGLSYDFYPWIASNAKMFKQSRWDDAAKTQGMLQTMPIDK